MARGKKTKVFVSYSRHDEGLVRPLAGLLGAAPGSVVFLDVTSLKPGDHWEKEIVEAVQHASVFVLCWCCESEKSDFVGREISIALSDPAKKLVPVLLCSAQLPEQLSRWQWVDLRGQVLHQCDHPHAQPPVDAVREVPALPIAFPAALPPMPVSVAPAPAARRSSRMKRFAAVAAMLVFGVVCLSLWNTTRSGAPAPEPFPTAPAPEPLPTAPPPGAPDPGQPNQTTPSTPADRQPDQTAPSPSTEEAPPRFSPVQIALFAGGALAGLGAIFWAVLRRSRRRRRQGEREEAEILSAQARRYFEGLGGKPPGMG